MRNVAKIAALLLAPDLRAVVREVEAAHRLVVEEVRGGTPTATMARTRAARDHLGTALEVLTGRNPNRG